MRDALGRERFQGSGSHAAAVPGKMDSRIAICVVACSACRRQRVLPVTGYGS